jgi:hypothetical protein
MADKYDRKWTEDRIAKTKVCPFCETPRDLGDCSLCCDEMEVAHLVTLLDEGRALMPLGTNKRSAWIRSVNHVLGLSTYYA